MSLTLFSQKFKVLAWPLVIVWLVMCLVAFCSSSQLADVSNLVAKYDQTAVDHAAMGHTMDGHGNHHSQTRDGANCCDEDKQLSNTNWGSTSQLIVIVSFLLILIAPVRSSFSEVFRRTRRGNSVFTPPIRITKCSFQI